MSSVQLQLEYLMAYWNMPCVITYPTPPYITLRMNIGFHQGPPLPRPRLFLDTIRKFSSAEDRRDRGEEESLLTKGEVYKIGDNQTSPIHDEGNKLIFYNPSSGLMASPKQNLRACFVITKYRPEYDTDKVPVTLKIYGTNVYLSCSNGELIPEGLENDVTLKTIQGPTKRFLFLRTREANHVTFESVMSRDMYICTDNISGPSPVNMSEYSDPEKIVGFRIDAEVGGIFVMVGKNRFSLPVPKETLKRLQEYKELMEEILMKGLHTGILFVGRLDI